MTANQFRRLALGLPEATESSHMRHPDFRVCGKIFATLGYPDQNHGVLILTPEEQQLAVRGDPEVFAPAKGAWGRRGSTVIVLARAKSATLRARMKVAWRKAAPTRLINPGDLSDAA